MHEYVWGFAMPATLPDVQSISQNSLQSANLYLEFYVS
jgi:hypothetical protein